MTSPSVPQDLVVVAGDGQATLNWSASTDDVAVTEYHVFRDAAQVATVLAPATTWLDAPLPRNANGKFLKRELKKELTGS